MRPQLSALERRPGEGRETVSHAQHDNAHDDIATAVCGAIVAAMPLKNGAYDSSVWAAVVADPRPQPNGLRFPDGSPRPQWGPDQPGAVSLGSFGYRTPAAEECWQLAVAAARETDKTP